ncbi:MAG: hypothetical protein OEX19_12620 [Gammaproteobacteria bacterium]|nr:hypothetical protein [Gammaproteobacteria bacterium]
MKTIRLIYGAIFFLVATSIVNGEVLQVSGKLNHRSVFSNINELDLAVRSSVENTITNSDSLSIAINEVVINASLADKPRVIEVSCTFYTYDGKTTTFSTVQRSILEKNTSKTMIDSDYDDLIKSQPLANVEKITLSFNLRAIPEGKADIFRDVSKLLTQAFIQSPAIEVIKSIIPSPEEKIEIPEITATFHVPNNFYHFEQVNQTNRDIPILFPDKSVEIAFSMNELTLPDNVMKNIFNAVTGTKYFQDEGVVSGYVKVTPTKVLKKQVHEKIMDSLLSAYNYIRSMHDDKLTKAENEITRAEAMVEVYYPEQSSIERINTEVFIRLLRLFSKYENGIDYKLAPMFAQWISLTNEFSTIQGIDKILVDNYYDVGLAALFYFPTQMDNNLVSASLSMQKLLHKSMKRLDKNKYDYLLSRVSEKTKVENVVSNSSFSQNIGI